MSQGFFRIKLKCIFYLSDQFNLWICYQFSSVAQLCPTLSDIMDCSTPGFPVHHQLPELLMPQSHPLSSPSFPAFNLSQHQGFFCLFVCFFSFPNESVLPIRWPKYWSFSFSIIPSNEYSVLISFRIDWFDLLAVQGTLKNLLQNHSSEASILQRSALFIVQLSHPYMSTGKTIVFTRWTFVGKVASLLFNMLSRLVIPFLPRSKYLLFSWLQSPFAVILEPTKNKVSHCFHCFPIYLPWSDGTGCHDLSFPNIELRQLFHSLSLSSRGSLVLCFLP